jgi:CRISPR-associated protein Cas6
MFWQEEPRETGTRASQEDVVDVSFPLTGHTLPVDHAFALYRALAAVLPWLEDEPEAGIHSIHVAASQNGWYRPDEASGGVLHISRRTRMSLRLPRSRMRDLQPLIDARLSIDGHLLVAGTPSVRPLQPLPTLFARYVASPTAQPEEEFLRAAASELKALGIRPRKMLCGRSSQIHTPDGGRHTRSLMVADLEREESIQLQRRGLGPDRRLGCGLFVPQKGIGPVRKSGDD